MSSLKIRFLCLPDVDRPIGGVKQLYRHAEQLMHLGYDASILTEQDHFKPSWFTSSASTVSLKSSFASGELTSPNTILVIPETYIGLDLSNFSGVDLSHLPRVIFNQNAYYTTVIYQIFFGLSN